MRRLWLLSYCQAHPDTVGLWVLELLLEALLMVDSLIALPLSRHLETIACSGFRLENRLRDNEATRIGRGTTI